MTCEKTRTGSVTNHCGDTKTGEITVPIPIFSQARRVVTSSRHTVRLTLPRPLPGREGGLLPSPTRGTKACRYLRTLVVQASRLHPSLVVMQAVLLICLLTGGCGRGAGDRKSVALVAVTPVSEPYVELPLYGLAIANDPDGYQSPEAWLPIEELLPEGSAIRRGDELLALNTQIAQEWSTNAGYKITRNQAKLREIEVETSTRIAELKYQRADLQRKQQVLQARIEASRHKDQVELKIGELNVQQVRQKLADAHRHLQRLRRLERDLVSAREFRKAQDAQDLAEQATRLPESHLNYLKNVTGSWTRQMLELDKAAVALDLGSDEHEQGIFASIAAVRQEQRYKSLTKKNNLNRIRRQKQARDKLMVDNTIKAKTDGVLRYRQGGLQLGDVPRRASAVFVLRDHDMGFAFDLPVIWRNLITIANSDDPEDGRVYIDIPQLGIQRQLAHVNSISVMPMRTESGRAYRCSVTLPEPISDLRDGMHVDCLVQVPVPAGSMAIPTWSVADPADPWVVMADGTPHPIVGQPIGHRFIVFKGLEAGQMIRAQVETNEDRSPRLRGTVRARETIQLRVPWRVEILGMVADGSHVNKGDVVATITRLRRNKNRDLLDEATQLRDEATTELALNRIESEAKLAKAYIKWRKAVVEVQRARMEYLFARYVSYEEQQITGDVAWKKIQVALRAARNELADSEDPALRNSLSRQELRAARLKMQQAQLVEAKTQLTAVAAARSRDWMDVWTKQQLAYVAEQEADALRYDYSLEREEFALSLARAAVSYKDTMSEAQQLLDRVDEETVRAPVSGHVYYNLDTWNGRDVRQLQTGRRIKTTQPFQMPVDFDREVRIEVPARFFERFQVGQEMPVHVSVLGAKPVTGKVQAISPYFHKSELDTEEYLARGTASRPPMVFTLTIGLELEHAQARKVHPGVMAWIENL